MREQSSACILRASTCVSQRENIGLHLLEYMAKKCLEVQKIIKEEVGRELGARIGNEWMNNCSERKNFTIL